MAREGEAMGAAVMEEVETVEVVMAVAVKEAGMVLCRVRAPREYTG